MKNRYGNRNFCYGTRKSKVVDAILARYTQVVSLEALITKGLDLALFRFFYYLINEMDIIENDIMALLIMFVIVSLARSVIKDAAIALMHLTIASFSNLHRSVEWKLLKIDKPERSGHINFNCK